MRKMPPGVAKTVISVDNIRIGGVNCEYNVYNSMILEGEEVRVKVICTPTLSFHNVEKEEERKGVNKIQSFLPYKQL